MATTSNNRRDAIYAVVSAQSNFAMLTPQEAQVVKANIGTIFGADLAYLVKSVDVLPGTFQDPAGATVSTPMGAGTVTTPTAITGKGSIT
jgi:hypothetical protein